MKIKIGFIGCGNWAQQTYLPFIRSKGTLELVSLASSGKTVKGLEEAQTLGFQSFYTSWQQMVTDEKLDLVFITTPHALHFDQIKACIEQGINVHVDKPPVLHFHEAQELLDLAKAKNLTVSVHSQRRFYKEYLEVKKLIEKDALGKIQFVVGEFGQQLFDDFYGSWRAKPELAGGGIMIDSGYHLLDSIVTILGAVQPKTVSMIANTGELPSDTFSTLSCQLSTECVITLNVIRGLPQNCANEKIQIIGSKGWVQIERQRRNSKNRLIFEHYDIEGKQVSSVIEEVNSIDRIAPLANLILALENMSEAESTLEKALPTIQILEAGYNAWERGKTISL